MRVYLASANAHKLVELQGVFAERPHAEQWTLELPPETLDVAETGATFAENALLKAEAGAKAFGTACLADDSGLCVDALGGRPGVWSARYAADDAARIARLLQELDAVPSEGRGAAFVCALALALPDGRHWLVEGRCEGQILLEPRGQTGFGYDPVFWVPTHGQTFAEMGPELKNAISHRARAAARLKDLLPEILRAAVP